AKSNLERGIAERERAQDHLLIEGPRERVAGIIDSSDDAIISKTPEGIFNSRNPGAQRMLGYTAEEEPFTTARICKAGASIDVSTTASPIVDDSGTLVGASKIAHNIPERERAERALRDHSKLLDLTQALVRDMQGRIVQWNLGAERLYGYTRADAIGRISHELLRTR